MVAGGLLVMSSTTRLVDAAALVRDARGDARQHIVGHAAPIGGHGIFGADRSQHNRVAVGARIALHGEVTGTGGSVFGNVVGRQLTDAQCRDFSRTRNGVDWRVVPGPVALRAVRVGARGAMAVPVPGAVGQQEDADRDHGHGGRGADVRGRARRGPLQHDELIRADDTPDGKQSMAVWRHELGLRGTSR